MTVEVCPGGETDEHGEWAVLEAFGVRVREVENLAEGAVWFGSHRLLICDRSLSQKARAWLVRNALSRAAV